MAKELPVFDLLSYYTDGLHSSETQRAIRAFHNAASAWSSFILTGTAVSPETQSSGVSITRDLFDLPLKFKMALNVSCGDVAWRGHMPLGGEHTHSRVGSKEGLYVGPEHSDDQPLTSMPPLGKNQFPDQKLPNMRNVVLD